LGCSRGIYGIFPEVKRLALSLSVVVATSNAFAQEPRPAAPENVNLEGTATTVKEPETFAEAPPMEARTKGFVLDATAGALFFLGQMGKVATPAPHFRAMFGYEPFRWMLLFARGELAFSTTGNLEEPPFKRAFPIFGFGAGLRATAHITERVAVFAEASIGVLKCDIATRALSNLGLPDAEKLRPDALARLGVEWYQLDRHFAIGLAAGARVATGFSRLGPKADTPLLGEAQATLRYTF
jgi:hypothetical protein